MQQRINLVNHKNTYVAINPGRLATSSLVIKLRIRIAFLSTLSMPLSLGYKSCCPPSQDYSILLTESIHCKAQGDAADCSDYSIQFTFTVLFSNQVNTPCSTLMFSFTNCFIKTLPIAQLDNALTVKRLHEQLHRLLLY